MAVHWLPLSNHYQQIVFDLSVTNSGLTAAAEQRSQSTVNTADTAAASLTNLSVTVH